MEYHYFTIEDVEMLKFNGITHLHNHLNYLIHTDKDQKFTNEDSVRNVSFIFDNKGNPKALKWTVQKPNYKGENFIGLLPNNRVYKNGFIYQFKTEKEAKQMIVDTYQKWKDSFDRMKADKESYPVVEYDNEPRVRGNLYLLTEPVKQLDGSKMLFSEHWYSGLNGYFYTLTLPYEDKMDLQGRILYQKDKIDNVSRYINRDLKDRHKAPIFYTYIDELIERCDYLVNELGYNDSEYMATLPDLKMLVEMYEKYEKEREIYLKDHPMVEQETDIELEEEMEDIEK